MTIEPDSFYPLDLEHLPRTWGVAYLRHLAEVVQPGFASGDHNREGNGIPQLRMANITREGNLNLTRLEYVPHPKATRIRKGEILFTNTNSFDLVGKTTAFDREGEWTLSNHMTLIRLREGLNPGFFARQLHYLWMRGYFRQRCTRHVNQASFGTTTLRDTVPLVVPPLAEQRRIVEAIEANFARLDLGIASLSQSMDRMLRFREAVVHEVVGSADAEVGLGSARRVPLSALGELARGKSRHRPRDEPRLYGGPYPFVQTGGIRSSGGWIRNHSQTYSEEGLAQSRLWPEGTLCITIAANIAETGILTFPACFPDSVVGFVSSDPVLTRWIQVVLRERKATLDAAAPATAQKNINLKTLARIGIPLPKTEAMKEAVDYVERGLSLVDVTQRSAASLMFRAQKLRETILRVAFSGHLVPQDPNDEPASVLLERIKREREMAPVLSGRRAKGARASA
ncbi:MAG: restriction endonuclease subunit S [Nitrososphaerota archaeon]|nr:restriction endonuclease subunit S [Nitrososphaerota archaeon]